MTDAATMPNMPNAPGVPVAELASWCALEGPPRCFGGWTEERITEYLGWCRRNGMAFVGQEVNWTAAGGEVQAFGVLVGWRDEAARIRTQAERGAHPIEVSGTKWAMPRRDGDCVFVSECVVRGKERPVVLRLVRRLIEDLTRGNSGWSGCTWLAQRHGKLVELNARPLAEWLAQDE